MLNRIQLLFSFLPLLVAITAFADEPRKNIVLILADDLGWADTTLYGKTSLYETPNIQRLANRGMTFTDAYASPICSPTRASIMTGQNPARHGMTAPAAHLEEVRFKAIASRIGPPHQKSANVRSATRLDPTIPTLGQILKDAGYATAHFGKWHLGREPHSPLELGFDVDIPHWYGPGPKTSYLAPWGYANPNFKEGEPGEHIEDRMARESVSWLKNHDRSRPFFMNYWQFSVHAPFGAKPELIDHYRKKIKRGEKQQSPTYAAMVHSLDDAVGSLLDALDASGIADQTVIVFYSDNGGNIHCGLEETDAAGEPYITAITSNHPLRGGKGGIHEGGVRVPAVVVWPGVTQPGSRSNVRIQSNDLYPTILRMLNVDRPKDHVIDGVDFTKALRGEDMDRGPIFTHVPGHGNTPQWLPPSMSVHHGEWKLIRIFHYGKGGDHEYRLYNLSEDIGENKNLAAIHPEKVKELDKLIADYIVEAKVVVPLPNPNFDPAKFDPSKIGVQAGGLKMPKGYQAPNQKPNTSKPQKSVSKESMLGWTVKNAEATVVDNSLRISPLGRQPFIANAKVRASGPVEVKLRIRAPKDGNARLQWRTQGQESFPKDGQSKSFGVAGGDWQELSVPLTVEGELIHVRLFLPSQKRSIEIDWIEIGTDRKKSDNRKRWDFDSPKKKAELSFQPGKDTERTTISKSFRGSTKRDQGPTTERIDDRPNFVFIFADDLGYGDLACYGHPYAKTPALDQLASEGTRFTQAYAAGATCMPSRTGIMTGRSWSRYDKRPDDFGLGDRVTVTELLNNKGYSTGHFGKWHIGMDRSNGIYGIDENKSGGRPDRFSPQGRDTPIFDAALDFIKRHKNEPFYVNIWGFTSHSPVASASNFLSEFSEVTVDRSQFSQYMQPVFDDSLELDKDLDLSMRHYLGNVYALDQNVKTVLDLLDELGLRDDTVVVFSSDQGPARPYGIGSNSTGPIAKNKVKKTRDGKIRTLDEHAKNMLGNAGVFRGNKGTLREGGLRVPFIIRWPGQIHAGAVDRENIIAGVDWLPSICKLAGVTNLPNDLDGEDISDIWRGATRPRQKPLFWNSIGHPGPAIRDGKWKYYLLMNRQNKIAGEELYDIPKDPGEKKNLAKKYPEVAIELKKKVLKFKTELPEKVQSTGKYKHLY